MWRIPLSNLNYNHLEAAAVKQVLDSGWLTMGPQTTAFEQAFATKTGSKYAVAVANCTCALELSYRYAISNSVPPRSCIIVPDITFVATANAVISAGGTPILCDVESSTKPGLSIGALKTILSSRSDIAAVALVHYAGIDAGVEAVIALCQKHDVSVIEDCAHASGAYTASGRQLGTVGFAGCFSFFSNKNLATGEGGMITTNDAAFSDWLRLGRSHGVTTSTWNRHTSDQSAGYDVLFPGHNYRCTELTAALGLVQLQKLDSANERRRRLTELYVAELSSVPDLEIVKASSANASGSSCHILSLLCADEEAKSNITIALTRAGIQTSHHYSPIHGFTWYSANNVSARSEFTNASAFAARQITLPLHPGLSEDDTREICQAVRQSL